MSGQESKDSSSSRVGPRRSCWRLHRSTYVFLAVLLLLLALVNVPGQVVVAPDPLASKNAYAVLASVRSCEHGWPVTYLWRESVGAGKTSRLSPWALSEGVLRISYLRLGLDFLAGAAVLVLAAVIYEAWRRRRAKIYQFHLSDLLVLVTALSVVFAWLRWEAKQHHDEQEVLTQLGVSTTYCRWQPGGPSWIREWIGDERFQIFDRVVQVELGQGQQFARYMRRAERTGVLSGNNPLDYATAPHLPGTDLGTFGQDSAFPGTGLPDSRDVQPPGPSDSEIRAALDADLVSLHRLKSLCGLVLNQTGMSQEQMAQLAGLTRLQNLEITERWIGDEGLAHLAGLTHLQRLSLSGDWVTDDGLVHLEGLRNLRNLILDTRGITSDGLTHLEGLTNLERLQVDSPGITGAGLAHLSGLTRLKHLQLWRPTKPTDTDLAHLAHLTALEDLYLDLSEVTDAGLEHLGRLTNLRSLDLQRAEITDAGLAHLKRLTSLRSLHLSDTQITDAGLVHLETLSELESLLLDGTQVADTGLVHLEPLSKLRMVDLRNSRVTKQGAARLQKAFGLRIYVVGP